MRTIGQPSIKNKFFARGKRAGFTFVELLVVIAIIVSLSGLLLGWALSARRSQKVRSTQAAMSNLLLVVDTVKHASPIFPDHRLANYFYIQPHTAAAGVQPTWAGGANNRRMGSGEFLAFLASLVSSSNTMIASLGPEYLPASPVPGSWGAPQDAAGVLVDVFEQDPIRSSALDKDKNSAVFSLVSPKEGYRLRAPTDAWGNLLVYRLSVGRNELNQADTETAPTYDLSGAVIPGATYKIRENILQDEQFTRDRYAVLGAAVDAPTATPATQEYVRPAVAGYAHPSFISPGPDGLWGAFTDLSPPNAAPQYTRDAMMDPGSARNDAAKDNIYSQEAGR